ncbi:MAG: hypothetical protein ACE5EY_12495, partial [Anaerolineae bacterium]
MAVPWKPFLAMSRKVACKIALRLSSTSTINPTTLPLIECSFDTVLLPDLFVNFDFGFARGLS